MTNALLIDYEFCTGCHTCEIACQQELSLPPDKFGIKISEIGPVQISERVWVLNYVPVPTDRCNRCAPRVAKGKKPSCVQHCQAGCMYYGNVDDLAKMMDHHRMALFT
jgi:anaerobic dimethyl sulfoxide reductase subunit B (iron-sulfur subunit)